MSSRLRRLYSFLEFQFSSSISADCCFRHEWAGNTSRIESRALEKRVVPVVTFVFFDGFGKDKRNVCFFKREEDEGRYKVELVVLGPSSLEMRREQRE